MRSPATRAAALLWLLALSALLGACGPAPPAHPNVIVVVLDTTRADHCGFNGYDRPTTPHLDAFVEDAVVFRDAWTSAPWTTPSHASLFTGLRPENHGLVAGQRLFLDESATTLAERFQSAGYATAAFSNNYFVSEEFGLAQGFDRMEPLYRTRSDVAPSRVTHYMALQWLRGRIAEEQPYFLFINQFEPHLPYTPEDHHQLTFLRSDPTTKQLAAARGFQFPGPALHNLGVSEVSPERIDVLADLYDAEIATLDEQIGKFLQALDATGTLDETIIVFTADHGEHLGENGMLDHMFSLHRALLQVPLVIRYPGTFDGGRKVDDLVRLEDVAPTLLELAGLPPLPATDGRSLTSELRGRVARAQVGPPQHLLQSALRRQRSLPQAPFRRSGRSVVADGLHYFEWTDGSRGLYEIASDPHEAHDLSRQRAADVKRLRALLPPIPGTAGVPQVPR